MRICFIAGYYKIYTGGLELQCRYLAEVMRHAGWEVSFITKCKDARGHYTDEDGTRVFIYPERKLGQILLFPELWKLLKLANADIYYQRGANPTNWLVARFCKENKRRFIWAMGSAMDCNYRAYWHWRKTNRIPKNVVKNSVWKADALVNDLFYPYGIRKADVVIAQSNWQKKQLQENLGVNSVVVRNMHPCPESIPDKLNPPMVLWLATLKPMKQPELFIELAKHFQDLPCRFVLAGNHSEGAYWEKLKKRIQDVDNLKYIGGVDYDFSNELIDRASVFINTSLHEGFPNTFIQAWMRETPTVSLNVDPDDVIKKYKMGFHSKTFGQMVKDIKCLIQREGVRKERGANARAYTVEYHNIEKNGYKFIDVCEALLWR